MRRLIFLVAIIFALVAVRALVSRQHKTSGAPPYGEPESEVPSDLTGYANWVRPEGPAKVALQVGHWKNTELPDELDKLRGNTGSSGGGKWEWEVNLAIAEATAVLLQSKGIEVELLPATVPPRYWADVFLAIHADGSEDRSSTGFKVARPWRDLTGNGKELVGALEASYQAATQLSIDPNVSRNMRGYYAFSFWRYEHAVHPMTTAAIIETGFLTSASDRELLLGNPKLAARGIAEGIVIYLTSQGLRPQRGMYGNSL